MYARRGDLVLGDNCFSSVVKVCKSLCSVMIPKPSDVMCSVSDPEQKTRKETAKLFISPT